MPPSAPQRAVRAAVQGERKQITVLFVDIRNSMALAEQVGAEEWHRVLDRFFRILNEGVYRFEGTVNQYTGDGIMALFGAPLAQEDHAQRACHAALHLRDRLRAFGDDLGRTHGLEFAVRMGLNSGEVVVGSIGDAQRMDYTAQGHTVGLAQRVEQLAAPNTACVAQATAALVADYFDLRDLGTFPLKGVSEPVRVYELAGWRAGHTRIDVVQARSTVRFVGRRAELARLHEMLDDALAGHGQVVGVVGEPGIGKTRLCLELARHARARGATLARAHCPPHATSLALLPILELVRSLFGIDAGDAPDATRRKIQRALRALSRRFADALPLVWDLLEVPDPARPLLLLDEQRRTQRAAFLRRLIQAQSAAGPLVLFIDDVHCIDPEGEALLGEVVEALGWTRTLLLVNFRPGYRAGWMTASYYRELTLAPLLDDEVDRLLCGLVGDDASTVDLRRLIGERTGGNPFFAEEVVQSLVDHGALAAEPASAQRGRRRARARPRWRLTRPITDLAIPASVQALLAARLDRLPEPDKLVLQAAAVIGRDFSPAVLGHVLASELAPGERRAESLPDSLGALERADFIRRDGDGDGADYTFKHPLTQAVAYESQLAESRARLHVAVARALQAVHADRLGQCAGLLAHHFAAANWTFEATRWRRRAALRVTSIEVRRPRRG
jgi:class 3 adenylate cyclase